jgi:NAD(P)-dependent dehydrogenase (short-subunit alcohol dehydrogenase family)
MIWLVTGANRGIGLELCRQLRARGDEVLAACRTPSKDLASLGAAVLSGIDVTSKEAPTLLLRATEGKTLDVLLHNAGILADKTVDIRLHDGGNLVADSLDGIDEESMRQEFEVNALAPLRLTKALLPRLRRGSKIALMSSRAGSIGDNASGGLYGYRMSKAALNMAGMSLARDLAPKGILVAILHPGFIRTDMTGGEGNDDPPVAAKGLLARIDELSPATSGKFLHANGQELPW